MPKKAAMQAKYVADPKTKKAAEQARYQAKLEQKKAVERARYRAKPEKKIFAEWVRYRAKPEQKKAAERARYSAKPEQKKSAQRKRYWACHSAIVLNNGRPTTTGVPRSSYALLHSACKREPELSILAIHWNSLSEMCKSFMLSKTKPEMEFSGRS